MKLLLCSLTLAFLCLFAAPRQAQACSYAVVYGASWTWQSGSSVHFYSGTDLDYCAGLYYDPATYGRYSESSPTAGTRLLGDGYTEGYSDWLPAEIEASFGYPYHDRVYHTDTNHYVLEYYQYYGCFSSCGYYWYDPWGYGYAEGSYGGPNYYGYGGAGYWSMRRRWVGFTWHSTQYRSSACLAGQTHDANGNACPLPPAPRLSVAEVGFKNDHKIKRLSDDSVIDPNDDSPTWVSGRSTNNQYLVAYTRDTRPTVFAKLAVSQAGGGITTANVRVRHGSTVLAQVPNVSVAANGNVLLDNVTFAADLADASRVKRSRYTFTWEVSFDGSSWSSIGNSGEHEIHWLYGAPIEPAFQNPGSAPNAWRTYSGLYDEALNRSTAKTGDGLTDIDAIADRITKGIPADLIYNPGQESEDRHPLMIYRATYKGQQCSDNVALLRGLLRSVGIGNTTNFFWGGDPSSPNQRSHWFVQPGTAAIPQPHLNLPLGGNVTARFPRPPIDTVPLNPYFTFHSTLRVGPANKSYDPSYGIVEDEVSLIRAVNSAGTCLTGAAAANTARIISTNLSNLSNINNILDFGYACGTRPSRSSSYGSMSIPSSMEPGQTYAVSLTMTNTGEETWTPEGQYRLGSRGPDDNWTWGLSRVELPAPVPTGGQVTFNFYVTAPYSPGVYNFQWKMLQEGVEWFDEETPGMLIEVSPTYRCDPREEQACWDAGGWWEPNNCACNIYVYDY